MSSSDDDVMLPGTGRPSSSNNGTRGGRGGNGGRVLRNFVAESNLSSTDSSDDDIALPGTGSARPSPTTRTMGLPSTSPTANGGGAEVSAKKVAPKRSSPLPSIGTTNNNTQKQEEHQPKQTKGSDNDSQVIGHGVALSNYDSGTSNQLVLREGDKISITEKDPSGWWVGKQLRTGDFGLFPSTYVQEVSEEKAPAPAPVAKKAAVLSPPDMSSTEDSSSADFHEVDDEDDDEDLLPPSRPSTTTTPAKPAATASTSPGQALEFTPATPSQSQAPASAASGGRRSAATLNDDDDSSDVSLNLEDSTVTNMTPMRQSQSPATLHKASAKSRSVGATGGSGDNSVLREESLGETVVESTSFKSTVGKTEIDTSPRQTVGSITRKYAAGSEEPAPPALTGGKKKPPSVDVSPTAAPAPVVAAAPPTVAAKQEVPVPISPPVAIQEAEHQEDDDRDRDPALDDILPPATKKSHHHHTKSAPLTSHPVVAELTVPVNPVVVEAAPQPPLREDPAPVTAVVPEHHHGHGQDLSAPHPRTPSDRAHHSPAFTSPSPTDPTGFGTIRTASPNRPPTGFAPPPSSSSAVAAPPVPMAGVNDRNRQNLLQRAHERLSRRDSGSGHLYSDRAPSPSMDPGRHSGGGGAMVVSTSDQIARDRLARENSRLTEELSFLQKDNQRLRQGLTETHSSESHRLKTQLGEAESGRKEHELTIARMKLQYEAAAKDAADHERNLKEELRAYSTTLEQFESVCSDKDQQLTVERGLTSKLKQDLKEKEAEYLRSVDDASRIREDSKVRLERTNDLLEDAKKQRAHLIELNDKFGRDKEAAVAERKRISEELKGVQLELARQNERAEDDAAASRRECDRYKALVQEKERVLGMRVADEQRSKEHYQGKLAEVEDQLLQVKTHQQEVLRTIQEEHRRQVSQVRDETAEFQIKCREAQTEADSVVKRFEERLDIERKQLVDEMSGIHSQMERDLNDARAAVNRDESYINELKQQVGTLTEQFETLYEAQAAKDDKLEAQEVELKTVTETLETLLNSDDHVGKERDELIAEIDKARVEMANMRDDVAMVRTLDDQLQELSRECERLSEELSRVSRDRSSLWTENHRLEGEVASWRSESQELRANLKGRGISARVSSGGGNHDFTY